MGSRSTNIRTKVVALLVSLACLWAFAAWVTLRDGLNLLGVQTLSDTVSAPAESLLRELQTERRLTVGYLGKPTAQQRDDLETQRQNIARLTASFKDSAQSWQAELASSTELKRRIGVLIGALEGLDDTRSAIDNRAIDRTAAATAFDEVIRSIFRVYDSLGNLDDHEIARDTSYLIELNQARELISQEDALLAGIVATGRMTDAEQAQFAQLVGAQRFLRSRAVSELPVTDQARYDEMINGSAFTRLRDLEDHLIQNGGTGGRLQIDAAEWTTATEQAMVELLGVIKAGGDEVVDRAVPVAIWVIVRMLLMAGLGLLALIASIIVSVSTARNLIQQLDRLREAAWQLANERLPGVVNRLGRGEEVDVASEAPPLSFGGDEVGQVSKAFNAVQETAIRTAVEQAELRRSVRDVFLSLARRTQALVHRQLTLLDAMERRETDAEELEDLFRVDHLATRMRRNAENLIVLSGSTPGRTWRRNVPMVDVVRGAMAEVEDYARVTVLPIGSVSLAGRAVGDVIHLLAELIENALSFSPPHTGVQVSGQMVANGYVIEVEDRGLGMTEEELADANERIASHPEFSLSSAARLGLYVVSRLTERHGIRVHLKESPYGGTTAVVLIPAQLVGDGVTGSEPAEDPAENDGAADGQLPVRPSTSSIGIGAQPGGARTLVDEPAAAPERGGAVTAAELPVRPGRKQARTPVAPKRDTLDLASSDPVTALAEPDPVTALAEPDPVPAGPDPRQSLRSILEQPTAALPQHSGPAQPGPQLAVPAAAAQAEPDPDAGFTPSGLPLRVRQASLVPALLEEPATPPTASTDDEEAPRPPDQIRQMMSRYQSGTRQGRTDAARLLENGADQPPPRADI